MKVEIISFNCLVDFCKVGVQKEFNSNGCKTEDRLRNGRLEPLSSEQVVEYVDGWAVRGKPQNVEYFIKLFPEVDKAWSKARGFVSEVVPTIADDSFIV
jgi:hypothetical protein